MKTLLFVVLTFPFAFAQENCDPASLNCAVLDQVKATLKLKREGLQEKDFQSYLDLHNAAAKCPGFSEECPTVTFDAPMDATSGYIIKRTYYTSGSPCAYRRPSMAYVDKDGTDIANQAGGSILLKIESKCQANHGLRFTAYPKGLLVMSDTTDEKWMSHDIARRIEHGSSEAILAVAPDGKNLRLTWKGKGKEQWLDFNPKDNVFVGSSFMKIEQLNSGTCKVEQHKSPDSVCNGIRKKLLKNKQIKVPEEYECIERAPVIDGVPSTLSRG